MQRKLSFYIICTQCLLIFIVSATSGATNYCGPKFCNNSKMHTLCKFQSPGPSSRCTDHLATVTFEDHRRDLLDKINSRRNKIASGELRSFPAAENMMKLVWNDELEMSAQRWADQCIEQNTPELVDTCRDLGNVSVGQIIASVYGEAPGLTPVSLVDVWYMELLNINSSVVPRYRPSFERGFSHYDYFTQLVWARSREVGCGGVKFKERNTRGGKNRTVHRLVCNFAPGGNVVSDAVYSEGPPCSRCPERSSCDAVYTSLCSAENPTRTIEKDETDTFKVEDGSSKKPENLEKNEFDVDKGEENSSIFDYFSEIYDYTKQPITPVVAQSAYPCKDEVAVDEFVELLKKKLSTDPMFKDLLSTKNPLQSEKPDSSFTDPSVAAFVSRIYSKKESTTTTKPPEQDYVNSTLLVDLVEAVIFRSGDKQTATEEPKETPLTVSEINPVRIQAELAEIKLNQDFTGHYFFPEDSSEESIQETTETTDNYYDSSSLPVSDVIFEIESLKKNKVTQDFLDAIIDSDTGTDENNERREKRSEIKRLSNDYFINNYDPPAKLLLRSGNYDNNIVVKYSDLLKKMASDFKLLKLNEKFHCAYAQNDAVKMKNHFLLAPLLCNTVNWIFA